MARRYYYSLGDRRAILALALLAVGFSVAVLLFYGQGSTSPASLTDSISADTFPRRHVVRQQTSQPIPESGQELFAFDPNTADSTALLKLGLSRWQVVNIYKYRNRGGVYRKPSDFARLYGLTVHQYKRLEPYIHISPDYSTPASSLFPSESDAPVSRPTARSRKLQPGENVDLNVADTTQLQLVPGIGSYFARRIVQYRDRLGGYVSVGQLDEIEDFPASAKSFLTVTSSPLRLDVNKLSLAQLRRHPYINYYQARAIVEYRRLRGPFQSLEDLASLPDFTPQDIQRLSPYLEF
ncbi:MAG: helix-hairpin-helix domain-containing protein [Prevotellaceae bacterium]|nr:helix-hairpin-helix domain-containing protein [Prevotellaceae bacterium]